MITIVLGALLFMSITHSKSSRKVNRTIVAVQTFLAVLAILLLALSTLMILNNFHVDYYG